MTTLSTQEDATHSEIVQTYLSDYPEASQALRAVIAEVIGFAETSRHIKAYPHTRLDGTTLDFTWDIGEVVFTITATEDDGEMSVEGGSEDGELLSSGSGDNAEKVLDDLLEELAQCWKHLGWE